MNEQLGSVMDWKQVKSDDEHRMADLQISIQVASDGLYRHSLRLRRLKDQLALPQVVVEEALRIARKVMQSRKSGARRWCQMEACLFIACRTLGVPRSAESIAAHAKMKKLRPAKIVRLAYEIAEELRIDISPFSYEKLLMNAIESLRLPRGFYHQVRRRYADIKPSLLTDHKPRTVMAVLLYSLCQFKTTPHRRTQKEIAVAFGLTEYTVRTAWKQLKVIIHV